MRRCTFQDRAYVLSRQRSDLWELVDVETGELKLAPSKLISNIHLHPIPPVSPFLPLSERPLSFLTELRSARAKLQIKKEPPQHKPRSNSSSVKPRKKKKIMSELEALSRKFNLNPGALMK